MLGNLHDVISVSLQQLQGHMSQECHILCLCIVMIMLHNRTQAVCVCVCREAAG